MVGISAHAPTPQETTICLHLNTIRVVCPELWKFLKIQKQKILVTAFLLLHLTFKIMMMISKRRMTKQNVGWIHSSTYFFRNNLHNKIWILNLRWKSLIKYLLVWLQPLLTISIYETRKYFKSLIWIVSLTSWTKKAHHYVSKKLWHKWTSS